MEATWRHVALLVGVVHTVSGIAALFEPTVLLVTRFSLLLEMMSPATAAGLLIWAGALGVWGSREAVSRPSRIALVTPQQTILLLELAAVCWALLKGRYPDGYEPEGGALFILVDQLGWWFICASHTALFIFSLKARGGVRGKWIGYR
jgi:hypothetical protein